MVTQPQIQIPQGWEGSGPEYVAYQAFVRLGKRPGEDFSYQSPLLGGRMDKGGFVIDFIFANPPDLGVNVQGVYYHYTQFPNGVETKARDTRQGQALRGRTLRWYSSTMMIYCAIRCIIVEKHLIIGITPD